jgi:hypothetical protein
LIRQVSEAPSPQRWRHRFAGTLRDWAQRRLERRLQAEWEDWRRSGEIKPQWFRRESSSPKTQHFRSLLQVNVYRGPRR